MPGWEYLDVAPGTPPGADVIVRLCIACCRTEVIVLVKGQFVRRMYLDDTPVLHKN
jgi:hypothetical protein